MLPLRLESRAPALPPNRLARRLAPARQQGVAMVVVLMLMLALMGIVAFSARNATFGEASSRNQLDGEIARQAAESAMRDAERDLLLSDGSVLQGTAKCKREGARPLESAIAGFSATCVGGQCDKSLNDYKTTSWVASSTNAEPWWPTAKGGLWGDPTTKPQTVNAASCATFTGGVPIGLYTGAPAVPRRGHPAGVPDRAVLPQRRPNHLLPHHCARVRRLRSHAGGPAVVLPALHDQVIAGHVGS